MYGSCNLVLGKYIFFMFQIWMVGRQIGVDRGGILNRSPTLCPEDSTVDWEYWSTAWDVSRYPIL